MAGGGIPHHAENREQKRIGIFIAILAVLMAVTAALAKNAANQMIVKEVEASNGFAWYQAKRQRSYLNELEIHRADYELAGQPTGEQRRVLEATRAKLQAKNAEYEKENDQIRKEAEARHQQADVAAHRHHGFEYAEIAMHIAVVLCSLTLLTEMKLFFQLGIAAAVAGVVLAGYTYFAGHHPVAPASDGGPTTSASAPAKH